MKLNELTQSVFLQYKCVPFIILLQYILWSFFQFLIGINNIKYTGSIIEKDYILNVGDTSLNIKIPATNIINSLKTLFPNNKSFQYISEKITEMTEYTFDNNSKTAIIIAGQMLVLGLKTGHVLPPSEFVKKHYQKWCEEIKIWQEKLDWPIRLSEEVFYFQHGLRFCPQQVRDYVKDGDMLDIGAYYGESGIVLLSYTNKNVYSYEISPKLVKIIHENYQKNKVYGLKNFGINLTNRIHVINEGISDTIGKMSIEDVANLGGYIEKKKEMLKLILQI